MLAVCDKLAGEFNITFNAKKSTVHKKISAHAPTRLALSPLFSIGSNSIESVSTCAHLAHLFNANLLDDDHKLARRNSLIGQVSSFLCHFSEVDILVKSMLFRVYCSSKYNLELWDLANRKIEEYCIAWRELRVTQNMEAAV
jgi:hypothetical protein